jgi:hypothetical protein
MTGTTFGYSSISPMTLTALEDTGWYECNMSLAEPLLWGDYRSIIGSTITDFTNFALGPPATSWPQHYVPRTVFEKDEISCTYDHLAKARNATMKRRLCGERRDGECQFPEFYDATGIGFYGFTGLDYALIPYRSFICKDITNAKSDDPVFGTHFGPGAMCARSTLCLDGHTYTFPHASSGCFLMDCPTQDVITIRVGEDEKTVNCAVSGEQKKVDGFDGYIECPDPKIVCGVINMRRGVGVSASVTPSPFPSSTEFGGTASPPTPLGTATARTAPEAKTAKPVLTMGLGIGAAVIGLVLIVGILVYLWKKGLIGRRAPAGTSAALLAADEAIATV